MCLAVDNFIGECLGYKLLPTLACAQKDSRKWYEGIVLSLARLIDHVPSH